MRSLFLSTPSGWRATPYIGQTNTLILPISIHALRVEGDRSCLSLLSSNFYFYPRPPGGGRQGPAPPCPKIMPISIHALRVEGDAASPKLLLLEKYFYPRPPGGGRRCTINANCPGDDISIHALRVEGDTATPRTQTWHVIFLSTPSGWRATRRPYTGALEQVYFYPRPPGGGRPNRGVT